MDKTNLPKLNLPEAKLKMTEDKIWDILRKKYVNLTPEEWVRQNTINYLIEHLNFPAGLLSSEFTVEYNGMKKRADIVCFNKSLKPILIVECKAPEIKLSDDTFLQISKYAATLKASFLILTNGIIHYCAEIKKENQQINFLEKIPNYNEIVKILKD